ncbi:uncharacterized protein A1O9_02158 [Exophiala aquamarina CBS 119918]|uniref:SAC3/GANP/THP3 conserved domain-containing protein n=1 Tax=Exophiala aquamarina CBS 119918 TaxID=1182545 RepID=A0A072PLG4_9EURO|nr:uncharacterized protein A1O9_02158 [Exophiala aquamarina CBS 119918]KEF60597.1 hypothetical protein A1O9_02158 [Exophiala aquamarina CBS 119918]
MPRLHPEEVRELHGAARRTITRDGQTLLNNRTGRGTPASYRATFTPGNTRARGRGRGRGFASQNFNESKAPTPSTTPSRTSSPAPGNQRDFMNAAIDRFTVLKQEREGERAQAIRDGFLADPDKKTSLDNAITPVGTCTDMCPAFERVERIVQNMVDKAEKIHNDDTGKDVPAEDRMVKRFRRSAAGYDEQLPSDIRTPQTLRRTLDYLLDKVIGGDERLATVHKYIWDRTRGIRNDFSIQQVTKPEDVKIAVDCYERIARFHILSLHQLTNADNLWEGENFDAHQEREQLNNTLLSLLYYYDDHRQHIDFQNEGEFRAYCIIFELQSQNPDLEDRVQSWTQNLLKDRRVKTALKLYKAAGNTVFDQGPLRPMEAFAIAQNNSGSFWNVLASNAVSYVMACVAEIYFGPVRFTALDALWHSAKSAPAGQQAKSRDWSLADLTAYLRFDTEEETKDFCGAFELDFTSDGNAEYLDPTSNSDVNLDQSCIPRSQSFSYNLVEKKRYRRTLTAVINGTSVARAIREGWIEASEEMVDEQEESRDDEQSLFVPEGNSFGGFTPSSSFGKGLNPSASIFKPAVSQQSMVKSSTFGQPTDQSKFGIPTSNPTFTTFGQPAVAASTRAAITPETNGSSIFAKAAAEEKKPGSSFGSPTSSAAPEFNQSFSFTALPQTAQIQSPPIPSPSSLRTFGIPKKEEAAAMVPVSQPVVARFQFGEGSLTPAVATATAAGPVQQAGATSSSVTTVPGIFTLSDPNLPPFPVGSLQSHDRKSSFFVLHAFSFNAFVATSIPGFTPTTSIHPSAVPSTPLKFPRFDFANPSTSPSGTPPQLQQLQQKPQEQSVINQSTALELVSTSESFKFPAISSEPSSRSPNPLPAFSTPAAGFEFQPTAPAPPPLRNTISPSSIPPQASPEPSFSQKDKNRLVNDFARVALLRPHGLIQNFIEYNLPDIVKAVFIQHHRDTHNAAVASVRQRIIMRKFANLWRSLTWNNLLRRNADNRRQQFSETIKASEAKKRKRDDELKDILAAVEESKAVKRLMQHEKEIAEEFEETKAARRKENEATRSMQKVAGQKRKSLSNHDDLVDDGDSANPGPSTSNHKRSRTLDASSNPSSSAEGYAEYLAGKFPTIWPKFPPRSSQMESSTRYRDLRLTSFLSSGKRDRPMVDKTVTDYFRLKALGIDPDTPLVPLTEKQLEAKNKREVEEKKRTIERITRRHYHGGRFRRRPSPSPPLFPETSPPGSPSPVPAEPVPVTNAKPPTWNDDDDDDLLKQARAQRKELEEGSNWLNNPSLEVEQEIEEEVERRVKEELGAHNGHSSVSRSPDGLARVNGFEYLPAPTKLGVPLSRSEQRIRATGAHGLAFKPLRPHADYVSIGVAMSKRSASKYGNKLTSQQVSNPLNKKPLGDDGIESTLHDNAVSCKIFNSQKTSSKRQPANASDDDEEHQPYQSAFANSQRQSRYTAHDDEEEEELVEESDEGAPREEYSDGDYHLEDGEDEDNDEDDDLEADEDEDEFLNGGNQAYGNSGYALPAEELVDDAMTPSTNAQASRAASSVPGASADDAFVLSDSD